MWNLQRTFLNTFRSRRLCALRLSKLHKDAKLCILLAKIHVLKVFESLSRISVITSYSSWVKILHVEAFWDFVVRSETAYFTCATDERHFDLALLELPLQNLTCADLFILFSHWSKYSVIAYFAQRGALLLLDTSCVLCCRRQHDAISNFKIVLVPELAVQPWNLALCAHARWYVYDMCRGVSFSTDCENSCWRNLWLCVGVHRRVSVCRWFGWFSDKLPFLLLFVRCTYAELSSERYMINIGQAETVRGNNWYWPS